MVGDGEGCAVRADPAGGQRRLHRRGDHLIGPSAVAHGIGRRYPEGVGGVRGEQVVVEIVGVGRRETCLVDDQSWEPDLYCTL